MIERRSFLLGATAQAGCASLPGNQDVSVETFDIWPGAPPGGEGVTAAEEIIERSTDPSRPDRALIHVRKPTLKVFCPARPDGSAVLIAPGGGYQRVVLDKEGDETAMRLARAGVTAAVLVYRLPGDGWVDGWMAPVADAGRALEMLQGERIAGRLDPKRIGVLGFSAGGHLAAMVALHNPPLVADRPAFACLMYAAYLNGSGSSAMATSPRGAAPDLIARVGPGAPPVFLAHAADDATVPVANSQRTHAALQAAGVPSELHVFPTGGHGFGIARAAGHEAAQWPDLFLAWGRRQGFFG